MDGQIFGRVRDEQTWKKTANDKPDADVAARSFSFAGRAIGDKRIAAPPVECRRGTSARVIIEERIRKASLGGKIIAIEIEHFAGENGAA